MLFIITEIKIPTIVQTAVRHRMMTVINIQKAAMRQRMKVRKREVKTVENHTKKDKGKEYGVEMLFYVGRNRCAGGVRDYLYRNHSGAMGNRRNPRTDSDRHVYAHVGRNILYLHFR